MNCRQVQDLVSPYLDHELTGQQMLEMRGHLDNCPACQEEYHSVRQLKLLLRATDAMRPDSAFEKRLHARLAQEPVGHPLTGELAALLRAERWPTLPPRPQRGRRLANALAISCLAVLCAAAPFGSSTVRLAPTQTPVLMPFGDALLSSQSSLEPRLAGLTMAPPFGAGALRTPSQSPNRSEALLAEQYAQASLQEPDAVPLGDEAAARGALTMVNYSPR